MFEVNNKDTHLIYFTPCSSVAIVKFEHVIASWESTLKFIIWIWNANLNLQSVQSSIIYHSKKIFLVKIS